MARSRSSFEFDLSNAIASATSLAGDEKAKKALGADAMPTGLVSFGTSNVLPSDVPPPPAARVQSVPPPSEPSRSLPKLPDLSNVKSVLERCERIVQWIEEATGAANVFLPDAAGLPLAGSVNETEARLAGWGLVASSIATLASAVPGSPSPQFELHIGEGPFYQIIGFMSGNTLFIVGLNRNTPLTPRQAHGIRLACRYALGEMKG